MNETPSEPHPLDAVDDMDTAELPRRKAFEGTRAYKPLLKPSVYTAIGSAPVVVLASVASSNAPLNSPFASIADWVFRASATVMLIACGLILVAYRIPYFQKIAASNSMAYPISNSFRPRLDGLAMLVLANLIGLALCWGWIVVASWSGIAILLSLVASSLFLFCGLFVTMIIWHTGTLRAYAVGALTACILQFPAAILSSLYLLGGPQFRVPNVFMPVGIGLGLMMTTSVITGLVCAAYVAILTSLRRNMAITPPIILAREVRPGDSA